MSATASNGEVDGFDPLANKPKRSAKHKDSKDKGKKIASPNQFQQLQQKQVMNALIDASKNEQYVPVFVTHQATSRSNIPHISHDVKITYGRSNGFRTVLQLVHTDDVRVSFT